MAPDALGWQTATHEDDWLREAEEIVVTFACDVATSKGLRRACAAALTDDRLCVCDAATRLPFDQLEIGHITHAFYYTAQGLFAPTAGDKLLLIKCTQRSADDVIAHLSALLPITLDVKPSVDAELFDALASTPSGKSTAFPEAAAHAIFHSEPSAAEAVPRFLRKKNGPAPPCGSLFSGGRTSLPGEVREYECRDDEVETMAIDCEVRIVEHPKPRGRGLAATRDYTPGEIVWTEEPLLVWQGGAEMEVAEEVWRDPDRRVANMANFLQGHLAERVTIPESVEPDAKPPPAWLKRWSEVIQVNCWGYTAFEDDHRALFILGSLINHSCEPNMRYDTKPGRSHAVFRAISHISEGDELTIAYSNQLSYQRRYEELMRDKRFRCVCPRCLQPDPARGVSCAADGCPGGVAHPTPAEFGQPSAGFSWRCAGCSAAYPVGSFPKEAAEQWISTLVETHTTVDIADPAVYLVAAFAFAGQELGCRHWAALAVAEHLLAIDVLEGVSPQCYAFLARLVANWEEVVPGCLVTHPSLVQALGNGIAKLQDSGDMSMLIVSIARHLAPAVAALRGPGDSDAKGMASVASVSVSTTDCLLGFDWECLSRGPQSPAREAAIASLTSSSPEFREKVLQRLADLAAAMQARKDPYDM